MKTKKIERKVLAISLLFIGILLLYSPVVQSQNWVELPPYNTLWPLWSPALSPIDDVSGLPIPIVSSLASDTQLPIAPGLTWDPSLSYPWLLYNTFAGLAYFDPITGINLWPAPSLLNQAGKPAPIALPTDYANFPPTDGTWLLNNVFTANLYYRQYFVAFPFVPPTTPITGPTNTVLSTLLTPFDILGPILGAPSVVAPVSTAITNVLVQPTAVISGLLW